MQYRKLGQLEHVSAIGLGCMGMSEFYGAADRKEVNTTLVKAVELGVNFFDTADLYGYGDNEVLLGEQLGAVRKQVLIATKCAFIRDKARPDYLAISNKPDYIKTACNASLKRLNTDYIDLYYLHRIDKNVPIEESVGALKELVQAGKVRHIGLSEADAETIRRAHKVHPITAIQTEYSLWTRHVEKEILPTCRELNIGFVPYSPLGRGFLTGKINDWNALEGDDARRTLPRFQKENWEANFKLVEAIQEMANVKACTASQLALAWVLAQGKDIIPIPGTRRVKYLTENVGSIAITVSQDELQNLTKLAQEFAPVGLRYPAVWLEAAGMKE